MKNSKKILDYYNTMLTIRYSEESLVKYIDNGVVKTPSHLYSGQEAIATGMCRNLNKSDNIFGNHRSHGHYIAKGGSLRKMFAEIFCKETGCSKGRGGSMHLISPENGVLGIVPIVAGTISLAVGAALSSKIKKSDQVSVSFFGDGATGEGVLYESLNFAALKRLPIIFVCENNFYSTHLPVKEIRTDNSIFESAIPFGVKSVQVDGNDIFKVEKAAHMAIERCRKGRGPVFIEFLTYRFRGHVGPDDNIQGNRTDIRPKKEIKEWLKKDPINRLEKYIIDNKVSDTNKIDKIKKNIIRDVESAIDFAISSDFPKKEDLLKYVYK
jgi:acetoin:2,6-dichlorophenolindophenol oxidoreductase subunit alpha